MALPKVAPMKALSSRKFTAAGGPWDGLEFTSRIPYNETSLVIKIGEFHGRYKFCPSGIAHFEEVK